MTIVGGLDIHRKQLTFDYLDTVTGEVSRGQIAPADRAHPRAWLARFAGCDDVAFALEGCTGWRYVAEELAAAGCAAHVAEPADTAAARGRKRHAKTDKTDSRHLRQLLSDGRLPECWVPPGHILECRALLELYHDLRAEWRFERRQPPAPPPGARRVTVARAGAHGDERGHSQAGCPGSTGFPGSCRDHARMGLCSPVTSAERVRRGTGDHSQRRRYPRVAYLSKVQAAAFRR
jgi:hypothetical protein